MKIVLITRDRPELTRQTIETMKKNASDWSKHSLLVVFDQTLDEVVQLPEDLRTSKGDSLACTKKQLGVGGAKNYGAELYATTVGYHDPQPDDILMFSDNDMYYLPGWDTAFERALSESPEALQIGGWRHPFHGWCTLRKDSYFEGQPKPKPSGLLKVDAVTGNCFVIRWSDWLKYGPFDANALGPGQSEDYALSQRIKAGGGVVATLSPPVAIHCGLSNSLGEPATGWEEMAAMAEAQMKEHNIKSIWLATPDEGTVLLERKTRGELFQVPSLLEPTNPKFFGLNVGSGQRRFDNSVGWINVDYVSRPPDQVPDVVLDATKLVEHFGANSQDMVVLHHVLEHFGCGEADEIIRQCYEVLKPGGSLLLFVPDMRALAGRWLGGEISDYTFLVNTYGAYQGEEGDRHKWGYSWGNIIDSLVKALPSDKYPNWQLKEFDWRDIPGADIAKDWWILGVEVIK